MKMRAMVLDRPGGGLVARELPTPEPGPGEVLIAVAACGVCRTDLHVVDGELPHPKLPIVPGHEIVGRVAACGAGAERFVVGARVGVPWLAWTCGTCAACRAGRENLCDHALFTGYTRDGGYADHVIADERFCLALPDRFDDIAAAPLLCAGLIGYRALRMAGQAQRIGLYGFGAAAHVIAQVAGARGQEVYAFTRPGDEDAAALARSLGAVWAGSSLSAPPEPLDAALIFAPIGSLVPQALGAVVKGGTVVCAGIHMSDIPSFPYRLLWEERRLVSVANLTRRDGEEFMSLVAKVPIRTETHAVPLDQANAALDALRSGKVTGAMVLTV